MKIRTNSFVTVEFTTPRGKHIKTICLVDKVENNLIYCTHSMTSVDHGDYVPTKKLLKDHSGESLFGARLINSDEFDIVFDTNIIPRKNFKNI